MIVDMVVALLVTLLLGGLLLAAAGVRRSGEASARPSWSTAALALAGSYLIVLLGGRGLRPLGFEGGGASWTPFLLVGVLLALLGLAVLTGAPRGRATKGRAVGGAAVVEREDPGLAADAAGLLLLGLLAALMALWVVLLVL